MSLIRLARLHVCALLIKYFVMSCCAASALALSGSLQTDGHMSIEREHLRAVGTIPVGLLPISISVDPYEDRVFVANTLDTTVDMISARNMSILRTIPIGHSPQTIVVDNVTHHVLVATSNSIGGSVIMLDSRTGALLHTASISAIPSSALIDSQLGHGFILGSSGSTSVLMIIDMRNGKLIGSQKIFRGADQMAISSQRHRIVVVGGLAGNTYARVFDTRTGLRIFSMVVGGAPPAQVAIVKDQAFVLNLGSGNIVIIDMTKGYAIQLPVKRKFLGMSELVTDVPAAHTYIASSGWNEVSTIDIYLRRIVRSVPIPPLPTAIAVDNRHECVIVTSLGPVDSNGSPRGNGYVTALDAQTGRVKQIVRVGIAPVAIAVDEQAGRAFVLNAGKGVRIPMALGQQALQHVVLSPSVPPTTTKGLITVLDMAHCH